MSIGWDCKFQSFGVRVVDRDAGGSLTITIASAPRYRLSPTLRMRLNMSLRMNLGMGLRMCMSIRMTPSPNLRPILSPGLSVISLSISLSLGHV